MLNFLFGLPLRLIEGYRDIRARQEAARRVPNRCRICGDPAEAGEDRCRDCRDTAIL